MEGKRGWDAVCVVGNLDWVMFEGVEGCVVG